MTWHQWHHVACKSSKTYLCWVAAVLKTLSDQFCQAMVGGISALLATGVMKRMVARSELLEVALAALPSKYGFGGGRGCFAILLLGKESNMK